VPRSCQKLVDVVIVAVV
jgi:hypothetical protein